ncbi:hypothetical protein BGZ83_008418 [Gryganskiella cystojenkinii]|nr:hypothetical protein BGZ83_008418 [Gryganskiella cystojenkinii]
MTSWRSKGAEILSKKTWGRTRKNSEPTYAGQGVLVAPIFGSSIDDAVRVSHIPGTPMVPAVLYRCAEFLEAKGIHEVGLYRVPGSHASVQKLKRMFESGKDHNLLAMDGIDPNDIATLLKLYLRELPTPLLPAVFLEQFQSLISMDRQICHSLRGILIRLPRSNYVVLSFLCHHLSRIAAHADKTKMNVSNLGVVFAPTLSIGSILFRALLGGFYDTEDTAENREKGLKLVWGGLLQDFEYSDGNETWPEGQSVGGGGEASHMPLPLLFQTGPMSPEHPLSPAQEVVMAVSQSLAVPTATTGLGFTQSLPNEHQFPPSSPELTLSQEEDEAKLLASMVLREERAVTAAAATGRQEQDDDTCSNVSSGSLPSVDCTDNTALSTMSSPGMQQTSKEQQQQAFEASFTSPSMAFSSPTMMPTSAPFSPLLSNSSHLIVTASLPSGTTTTNSFVLDNNSSKDLSSTVAIPNLNKDLPPNKVVVTQGDKKELEEEDDDQDKEEEKDAEKDVQVPEFPHKSATGAPQLPPLEGLMISL